MERGTLLASSPPSPGSRFDHVVFPQRRRRRPVDLSSVVDPGPTQRRDELRLLEHEIAFLDWIFDRATMRLEGYRRETLSRRLPACLRALRVTTLTEARRAIEEDPSLVHRAIGALLVGVTSFFRDPEVFTWLANEGLVGLGRGRPGLYLWSVGCSDGAELYSLAIILAELGRLDPSYLLGTDCRPQAIEKARAGSFGGEQLEDVSGPLRDRYFSSAGDRLCVVQELRDRIRWRVADVLKGSEPGLWDVVFFRNTAMYLRSEVQHELWERMESSVRPGGLLVLGRAERPFGTRRLHPVRPCVFRRVQT